MKIDRMLAIVTYLLNHDVVTGKYLAEKFEVSERTIQRDIDTINLTGIPVASVRGVNGGYRILETYKLSKQTATEKDFASITLALRSLSSAFDDKQITNALEKITSIAPAKASSHINVDFGIAKENKLVVAHMKKIEEAISNRLRIDITYTNSESYTTTRVVEPISLEFKWYSWYLVAYCVEKDQYRVFKLARITDLRLTQAPFTKDHSHRLNLFEELISQDHRKATRLVLQGKKEIAAGVSEYLPGVTFIEVTEKSFAAELHVIESERMWFAFILSFGDDIEIQEPEHIKQRLLEHSKKIIKKYEIPDI